MRRRLLLPSLISLALPFASASGVRAQGEDPPEATEPGEASPQAPEEPGESDEASPSETPAAPSGLEPPTLAPIELGPVGEEQAKEPALEAPPPVEKKGWRLPETIFQIHGYFRLRSYLLKDGSLGHSAAFDRLQFGMGTDGDQQVLIPRQNFDPFPFFVPEDSANLVSFQNPNDPQAPIEGGCGDSYGNPGRCDKRSQVTGDMRLRLKPEIHLSDDVRVKAWIDVFDNVGLGTLGYGPYDFELRDTIRVRRVWGEARNRDIGELRFGRMGADWGLGILDNGGDRHGIDSDFTSDVDRIMGITNLGGFYLMAAYDWANQGMVLSRFASPSGIPIDRAQKDDLDAVTLSVARKLEPEVQASALARGDAVFNYGAYFIYRSQLLRQNAGYDPAAGGTLFTRFNQTQFIPDLWLQFLWEGLRVELEAAFVAGTLEGGCPVLVGDRSDARGAFRNAQEVAATSGNGPTRSTSGECKFRQFGVALETEYRLFNDRLGLYFMSGLATGDANAYGLAITNDPSYQRVYDEDAVGNRTISTFQFHPDYRVDLILWRTLMRRVAGAYYFKPGISYDFIRDAYGQQAGGRLDVIYSRATSPAQTWGNSANLGLELDVSLYYRSEDGPDFWDGFYGLVQWGVLFPFQGLDYRDSILNAPGSKNAMIFRGVAGIAF
jgi:uncharacterized protein (TIGR04551 family)